MEIMEKNNGKNNGIIKNNGKAACTGSSYTEN